MPIINVMSGAIMALLIAGCASLSAVPDTPEKAVMARAQARWDTMVAGQFDKAFEYISPSGRSTLPLDIFRGRLSGSKWRAAKVTKVVCEPEVCDVTVTLEVEVLPNLPQQLPVTEKWLLESGQWWFVYRG